MAKLVGDEKRVLEVYVVGVIRYEIALACLLEL